MGIAPRTRFLVLQRDNFTCQYCGRRPPQVVLEIDHIYPRSRGGSSRRENLTAACRDCNRGKGHLPLSFSERVRERRDEHLTFVLWHLQDHWDLLVGPGTPAAGLFSTTQVRALILEGLLYGELVEEMNRAMDWALEVTPETWSQVWGVFIGLCEDRLAEVRVDPNLRQYLIV